MSNMQAKWDKIYASRTVEESGYAGILDEVQHLLPATGRALDLACGTGAASIFLARRGLQVQAWDISEIAMRKLHEFAARDGLAIDARAVDITSTPIPENSFDVVFVSRFLERGICQALSRSLRPGGLLVYQTFNIDTVPGGHQMNPGFCLARGELLSLFRDLRPVLYREEAQIGDWSRGLRNEAWLVAERARPMPGFLRDWLDSVSHQAGGLSAAIMKHRDRLLALPDPIEPLLEQDAQGMSAALGPVAHSAQCLVYAEESGGRWRVIVVPKKGRTVLPSDLIEAEALHIGKVVDAVCETLRAVQPAVACRCWTPHPDDCTSRRVRVQIEPDSAALLTLRPTWPAIAQFLQQAIGS